MIRAGVLGPGDVAAYAPWCRLPTIGPRQVRVLFVVEAFGPEAATVEAYTFSLRTTTIGPRIALMQVTQHTRRHPDGEPAALDYEGLFWPPLDVVKAAELQAREVCL